MKNILKLLALILLTLSCDSPSSGLTSDKLDSSRLGDYEISTINGHTYIIYDFGIVDQRVYSHSHDPDCIKCKNRRILEMDSLIKVNIKNSSNVQ
jgi:hypothetical protein